MHSFHGKNDTIILYNGDYSEILLLPPGIPEEIEIDAEDFMDFARGPSQAVRIRIL